MAVCQLTCSNYLCPTFARGVQPISALSVAASVNALSEHATCTSQTRPTALKKAGSIFWSWVVS